MTDYQEYVEMIARNGLEMGESPRTIAQTTIVSPGQVVGDEQAILFSAGPFVDDPATQTRLWPSEVIRGTNRNISNFHGDTLREIAVEALKADLNHEMMEIENETMSPEEAAARAEIEAERRLDERRERHFDRNGHFGPSRPDPGPD